jgi:hypothetical protein
MKCSRCHALNAPGDLYCSGCRQSLAPDYDRYDAAVAVANTPQWAYVFVALCGILPILTLGGIVPIACGLGGAGSCLKVARVQSMPGVVRFLVCAVITAAAWCLVGLLVLALVAANQGKR